MESPTALLPLALLADDLTGAMDSGLQFARRGLGTVVQLGPRPIGPSPVLVLSSETREAAAGAAVARIDEMRSLMRDRRLFKKIDSTMRGNIGYELRAVLTTMGARGAIVAPAFPQGGRTVVGGELLVNGRSLAYSAFRSDPRWPMLEAHIPTYLMQQAGMEATLIPLQVVRQGSAPLADEMSRTRARLIVTDAVTDADLASIAEAASSLGPGWIPCGSAGLAQAWANLIPEGAPPPLPSRPGSAGGLLLVVGSRNPVSREQVERLTETGIARVQLNSLRSYEPAREAARLTEATQALLRQGHDVLLESCSAELAPGGGPRVATILGDVVRAAAAARLVTGLFLTGGDIALAVTRALLSDAMSIAEAIEPAVPGGSIIGGLADGLPVVTKAGGFGSPSAMISIYGWLQSLPRAQANDSC